MAVLRREGWLSSAALELSLVGYELYFCVDWWFRGFIELIRLNESGDVMRGLLCLIHSQLGMQKQSGIQLKRRSLNMTHISKISMRLPEMKAGSCI